MATRRYWRVNSTASDDGSVIAIADIEFRLTAGGIDETSAADAVAGAAVSSDGSLNAATAFDGTSVFWQSNGIPAAITYDFNFVSAGNEKAIAQVQITANSSRPSRSPSSFTIESSPDNVVWTVDLSIIGESAWSAGEVRLYTVPVTVANSLSFLIQNNLTLTAYQPAFSIENNLIPDISIITAYFKNTVFAAGLISADIQNIISTNTDTISATILNNLYDNSPITATFESRVGNSLAGSSWQARVTLDGVDMTSRLSGGVNVEIEEGAARIASFELMPFSGVIDPYDWIGAAVTIDYVQYDSSGVIQSDHRLFTGIVDEPIYDPQTRFTTFSCTDSLQEYFEQKEFLDIDLILEGRHSLTVFGETDDKWSYAQQRMASQPASFDFNAYGVGRKTDWQAKAIADVDFTTSNIIDSSLSLSLISRRDVVNTVNISLGYRFGRKWQRELSGSWGMGSFADHLVENKTLPNRQMILSALNSGWDIKSVSWGNLPVSGVYIDASGNQQGWIISDELRESLVASVTFSLAKRWLQDITEAYAVTVQADASIAKHGIIKADESYALDAPVDEDYEDANETPTSSILSTWRGDNAETATSGSYQAPLGSSVNNSDFVLDPVDRAEFDNAITTAIAEARVQILQTHRANTVAVRALLMPDIDVNKTASITTSEVTTKGKVRRVQHTLNTDTGDAFSAIEIAVYQPDVSSQVDDAVAVPALANTSVDIQPLGLTLNTHLGGRLDSPVYDPTWIGYIGNYGTRELPSEWYPREFRVDIPAIEEQARDAAEFTADSIVKMAIPQDTLIINA